MSAVKKHRILLTGGGSGGSVTPLLAIADELGREKYEFLWAGTRRGPERAMIEKEHITFKAITAVKFNRYVSVYTTLYFFFSPLVFAFALIQATVLIARFRPHWVLTAGSFVSVPLVWAGKFMGAKILVHQQDVQAGLANKLMARFAKVVTVTFKQSLRDYGKKAIWTGNPTRIMNLEFRIQNNKEHIFNLRSSLPVVLVLGGGTGSVFLNALVADSLPQLSALSNVIHVTGKGRGVATAKRPSNYLTYEFLEYDAMLAAYEQADVVVARAGLATITELSYFSKPAIIIPMPHTHQIANSALLESENAALVLDQEILEKRFLVKKIKELLQDKHMQHEYAKNIKKIIKPGAARKIAGIIH